MTKEEAKKYDAESKDEKSLLDDTKDIYQLAQEVHDKLETADNIKNFIQFLQQIQAHTATISSVAAIIL